MKKLILLFCFAIVANAHFLTLLPNTDLIQNKNESKLNIEAMFIHPYEQTGMNMEKPKGIFLNTKSNPLPLNEIKLFNEKAWATTYSVNKPGVYKFFTIPEPYFEPAEEKYISHVPKVIVSAYGLEEGWDEPIGLKYEIIPMVKPFALYTGNIFTGKVLVDGKPVSNVEVEVEFFNNLALKAPSDSHITQVVKTNANGEFSFVMNQKGWWGFAALIEEGQKEFNGKMYPIENGALMWVKTY
ncbi:DUF4198 domain-containing protein [Arcobacter sp. YIC-464]|uniref:DUF4198 domain-containing protein n=1 Tax=Arcobacter sp. YIC-464 TaxID=3376631 RepID=UPI003C260C3A